MPSLPGRLDFLRTATATAAAVLAARAGWTGGVTEVKKGAGGSLSATMTKLKV
ncbi:hypothetical protein BH11PLA2_BH11PLA2_49710 [soil metagenome]